MLGQVVDVYNTSTVALVPFDRTGLRCMNIGLAEDDKDDDEDGCYDFDAQKRLAMRWRLKYRLALQRFLHFVGDSIDQL
jgi:hypothetical protein